MFNDTVKLAMDVYDKGEQGFDVSKLSGQLSSDLEVFPEQATEALDQLLAFFEKFDQSEELRKRIYGIDQVSEKFEKKVFEIADDIGIKGDGQEAVTIAAQLNHDLNEARERRASLKKIKTQDKEIAEEIENADITIRAAKEQLAVLRDQARVETDDELEAAGESSRKMRELQQKLDTIEQELTRNGDGLKIGRASCRERV